MPEVLSQLESEPEIEQNGESQMAHPFHIPEKWKWIKLKHLATIVSGTSYKADDIQRSGVRIIRGGNLIGNVIKPCKDDVFLPHNFTSEDKTVASTDIVIVSSTGSKEGIGRSAVLGEKFECQIGAFLRIVRPKEKENSKYLQVLFRSNYYREYIRNIVSGTNINNIKNSYIEEFYAPVPPQEEQSRICSKLHECFSILAHAEHAWNELQALSENLKALLLLKAIKGEIVPQLESEPEVISYSEQPQQVDFQIPKKWKWIKLDQVASIVRGGSPRPIKAYITDSADGINWIKIGDAERGSVRIQHCSEKIKPEGMKKSRFVRKGSLLLTNSMSYGFPYILDVDGCIHDGWLAFSDFEQYVERDYLYYVLLSPYCKRMFSAKAAGAVVKNLNIDKVKSLWIPVPPHQEQKRIVKKLTVMAEVFRQISNYNQEG